MRERGQGRIVNISSIAGRVVTPMTGWYCASKHALEALERLPRERRYPLPRDVAARVDATS